MFDNSINVYYLLLSFLVVIIHSVIMGLRYKLILNQIEAKIKFWQSFIIIVLSQLSVYVVPLKIGPLLTKPYLTNKYSGVNINKAFAISLFEQIFEIGLQIIIVFFILLLTIKKKIEFQLFNNNVYIVAVFFFVIMFVLLNRKKIVVLIKSVKNKYPNAFKTLQKKIKLSSSDVDSIFDDAVGFLLNVKIWIIFLFSSILMALLIPLVIYLIVKSFNLNISFIDSFTIYWISLLAGRLSGLPGGLGSRDITMETLLYLYGLSLTVGLKIVLIYRIVAILPYFIIGAPFLYIFIKQKYLKKVNNESTIN